MCAIAGLVVAIVYTGSACRKAENEGFPLSEQKIHNYLSSEDVHAMRRHAWHVLAQITQNTSSVDHQIVATWETWHDLTETFSPDPLVRATHLRRVLEPSAELALHSHFPGLITSDVKNGVRRGMSAHDPASLVLYNNAAFDTIRRNCLFLQKKLNWLANHGKRIEFPKESIVVKTSWLLFSTKDKFLLLPVWEFKTNITGVPRSDAGSTEGGAWPHSVCIYINDQSDCVGQAVVGTFPLSDFYHFKIETPEILKAAHGVFADAVLGDYALLVGFHFATREQTNWVWATFWWQHYPDRGAYSEDRTPDVTAPWRHYLMNVSYDMDVPREADARPHIAYNPYLEAGFNDGVESNCMTCHRRAAWPFDPTQHLATLLSDGSTSWSDPSNNVVRGSVAAHSTYLDTPLNKLMPLSFLWTVAMHSQPVNSSDNALNARIFAASLTRECQCDETGVAAK